MQTDVEERLFLVITDDDGNLSGPCGHHPCPLRWTLCEKTGKSFFSMDRRHPSTPSLSFAFPLTRTGFLRVLLGCGAPETPRTCPVRRVGQGPLQQPRALSGEPCGSRERGGLLLFSRGAAAGPAQCGRPGSAARWLRAVPPVRLR